MSHHLVKRVAKDLSINCMGTNNQRSHYSCLINMVGAKPYISSSALAQLTKKKADIVVSKLWTDLTPYVVYCVQGSLTDTIVATFWAHWSTVWDFFTFLLTLYITHGNGAL